MPPLGPGDFLPRQGFSDPAGRPIDLGDAAHAGHGLVLAWAPPERAAASARELAAAGDTLAALDALAFVVCAAPPPASVPDDRLLIAPAGLFDGLADDGGLAVIDRAGSCLALLAGDGLAAALALLAAEEARRPPVAMTVQAPVLLLDQVLEPTLCRRLIAYWESEPKRENEVASARGRNQAPDEVRKRRADVAVADPALVQSLMGAFGRRVIPAVHKAFRVAIQSAEVFRIGCYSAVNQGAFARHRDNTTPYTAHRSFAVSVNLNTGDYEGGALTFPEYGRMLYAPPPGGAVVFSCALLHEALPVTAGRRFGLFTFLNDQAGAAREAKMRAGLEKRG